MRRFFCLWLLLACRIAHADGPHIALHGTDGAYTATLFTAPDPLVTGKVEFALLVQAGESGTVAPVRAAQVSVRLGQGHAVEAGLTPGANGSRDLLGGTVLLSQAGEYLLQVSFKDARGQAVRFNGSLPVAENHGRRDVVLFGTSIPLVIALLFLANQYAKQQLRAGRVRESRNGNAVPIRE